MTELHDVLTTLHTFTRWLIISAGAGALAIAMAAWFGGRPHGRTGARWMWAFLATLSVQAGLGVLIAVVAPDDAEPFDGDTATLVWHAFGGLLALAFVAIGVRRVGRQGTDGAAARTATMWAALAVLAVGSLAIVLALTALMTVARLLTTSRPGEHDTEDDAAPRTAARDGAG